MPFLHSAPVLNGPSVLQSQVIFFMDFQFLSHSQFYVSVKIRILHCVVLLLLQMWSGNEVSLDHLK